jgi:hypothetical protein
LKKSFHKLFLECLIEDGWQQGVEFSLSFGLQVVELSDNSVLF